MVNKKMLLAIFVICVIIVIVISHLFNNQNIDSSESHFNNDVKFSKVNKTNMPFFDLYQINMSLCQSAYGLASGDFNNDGLLDFVVSYATHPFNYSTVSLFINKGSLLFEQRNLFSFNYSYIKDLDAGDFDGDGDIDLVFSFDEYRWFDDLPFNMNGTLILARNNGTNDFSNLSLIHQWTSEDNLDSNLRINLQITSADYDRDGDIDIVVGDNSGKIELLLNQGNGSYYSMGIIHDFGKLSWGLTSRDINKDGYIDIMIAAALNNSISGPPGFLYFVPNNNYLKCFDGEKREIIGNISSSIGTGCLITIDIDKDEIIEIIAGIDDRIYIFNKNNNRYHSSCLFRFSVNQEDSYEDLSKGGMTVGDFNNDGYDDFITGGVQGDIRLFLNKYQNS